MSDARRAGSAQAPATRPVSLADLLSDSATLSARMANIGIGDWRRAVGPRLAERTLPERMTDGVLTVRVPSSTWAQELSLLSQTVLDRLRQAGHAVERLRFHVAAREAAVSAPVARVDRCELPDPLAHRIARLEDPALRNVLGTAAAYNLGRAKSNGG